MTKQRIKQEPKALEYYVSKINFMYAKYAGLFTSYFGWDYDDFKQEMVVPYLKGIKTHKPEKAALDTHIINCMKNYVIDQARKTSRKLRAPMVGVVNESTLDKIQSDYISTGAMDVDTNYSNPSDILEAKENTTYVVSKLSKQERLVYMAINSELYDEKKIAKFLKIKVDEVNTILDTIREKLYEGGLLDESE